MKHADRIAFGIIGTETVRADKLGKAFGLMGIRHAYRAHFMKHYRHATRRQLKGGFAAGKAATNNMNSFVCLLHSMSPCW